MNLPSLKLWSNCISFSFSLSLFRFLSLYLSRVLQQNTHTDSRPVAQLPLRPCPSPAQRRAGDQRRLDSIAVGVVPSHQRDRGRGGARQGG